MEKTYSSGHGGGGGGPSVVARHCTGSASLVLAASGTDCGAGADCGARAVGGGVKKSAGAVVGERGSGVARIGEDGPGGDDIGGVSGSGDETSCCWTDSVEGRGDPWRGERRSVSPSPLNSSASHRLFTAFLAHFAGGGEGIGE